MFCVHPTGVESQLEHVQFCSVFKSNAFKWEYIQMRMNQMVSGLKIIPYKIIVIVIILYDLSNVLWDHWAKGTLTLDSLCNNLRSALHLRLCG